MDQNDSTANPIEYIKHRLKVFALPGFLWVTMDSPGFSAIGEAAYRPHSVWATSGVDLTRPTRRRYPPLGPDLGTGMPQKHAEKQSFGRANVLATP